MLHRIRHRLRFLVPIERDRLLVERELVLLEQPAELDPLRDIVRAVRVGVADHLVPEFLSHHRDELLRAPGGVLDVAHAAADLDLERLGLGFRHLPLEVLHDRFGGDVAFAVGAVDGDLGVVNIADQLTHRFVRDAAEHVEDRKLDRRERHPQRQALQLVVALVDVHLLQQRLQIARVLAEEEWLQPVDVDRVERALLRIVRGGDAFRAVLRADAAQEAVVEAEQFERLDDHRRREELPLEHRLFQDCVELRVVGVGGGGASGRGRRRHTQGARHPRRRRAHWPEIVRRSVFIVI